MNNSEAKFSLISNSIESFKKLIGYELSTCRVVFNHKGNEIVFVNEVWLGLIRIYLNGDLAYRGLDWTVMTNSSGWFLHNGKTYKIRSTVSNLLTFAQRLSLTIDGEEVDSKTDDFYGKLSVKEFAHLMGGVAMVGALLVLILKLFGI